MTGDDTDRNPTPSESDLEWRLHAMLDARAELLDPQLHGPQLRASATPPTSAMRRAAPLLAAVATVAAIAVGVTVATTGDPAPSHGPVQPGGGVTAPSTPAVRTTVRPSAPVVTPTATLRTPGRPVVGRPRTIASSPSAAGSRPVVRRRTADGSRPTSTAVPHSPLRSSRPSNSAPSTR